MNNASAPQYRVVLNDDEQFSIWPADKTNPPGWYNGGKEGSADECLAHIGAVWNDITPRSVRRVVGGDRSMK